MNEEQESFIEVTIKDENGMSTILDVEPEDETIYSYVRVIARALLGMGFQPGSVEEGFAAYLEERGYYCISEEDRAEIDAEREASEKGGK